MLTFALVVARPGRRVPAEVRALLDDRLLAEIPFVARRHLRWTDAAGAVAFGGWQDTEFEEDPVGSRWHEADGDLTAFTGHLWPRTGPWTPNRPWAAELASFFRARPLAQGTDDLLGLFTAVALDADGNGAVGGDALGLGMTYWSATEHMTVFGSRASLVARLAATASGIAQPRRDALGSCWLAYCIHPMGMSTGYEGVAVLPAAAVVRINAATGARVEAPATRPWRFATAPQCDPHDLIDEVRADIATSIRASLALPVEHHVTNLTGGKDSRTITAVTLAEGLTDRFEYRTLGAADLPDVVVARQVAQEFGLAHDVNVVDARGRAWRKLRNDELGALGYVSPPDRETTIRLSVGSYLAMRNVCEPMTTCPPHGDLVVLSGVTGELLRTTYPGSTRFRALEDIDEFFHVDLRYGMAGILRPDARQYYEAELWRLTFDDLAPEDGPQDVIDGSFFLRNRLRRWLGTWREVDEENQVFPLYSPIGMRAASEMGVRNRHAEFFHHEIIRGASERLAEIPFAKGAWPKRTRTLFNRRAPRGTGAPPPVPPLREPAPFLAPGDHGPARTVRQDQRAQVEATDVEIMRRYLLDDPTNPVHDVVDRGRIAAALDRFGDLTEAAKRQIYGALGAAIWLGGAEITCRPDV